MGPGEWITAIAHNQGGFVAWMTALWIRARADPRSGSTTWPAIKTLTQKAGQPDHETRLTRLEVVTERMR